MARDIYELIDPYRGDLLYGFAGDRGEFYTDIQNTAPNDCMLNLFFASDKDATAWITVDHYSDSLFGGEKFFVGGTGPLLKQATGVQEEWVKYSWEKLSQHRFSPLGAFTVPYEKRASGGWNDLANDRYYLAIRRGCKFGIEHVLNAASQDAKIHFLLDRFDNNNGDRMVQATYKMASTARGHRGLDHLFRNPLHLPELGQAPRPSRLLLSIRKGRASLGRLSAAGDLAGRQFPVLHSKL